ncbi:MAG: hypothetical protein EON90_02815 [Brevundimonas sp.]|nr:MAG: hypothetical protein EON90_02815 [Brevundimonas sp.]
MINPESVPVEGGHGRLNLSEALVHSADPLAHYALVCLVLITIFVVGVVLINAVRAGRFHDTALALSRMLSLLAPILGLFSAAVQMASIAWYVAGANIEGLAVWAPSIVLSAWGVAAGCIGGGVGVILTAALRIGGGRTSRTVRSVD